MFIADYWCAAFLTIQTLPYFWLYFVMGLEKKKIYLLPTYIPSFTYLFLRKHGWQEKEWALLLVEHFDPSNTLHMNVFNTGVYCWFSISVLQVLYTRGCLHFWLQKAMTTNTQSMSKKGLSRRIRTPVPSFELLCHRHADLATFKYNHQSPIVGCLTGTERIFQRQYSNSYT